MPEQIHLGFGIDKNFGKFAGITITSLVHNNIGHDLIVHIVYDELLPQDIKITADRSIIPQFNTALLSNHQHGRYDLYRTAGAYHPGHVLPLSVRRYAAAGDRKDHLSGR